MLVCSAVLPVRPIPLRTLMTWPFSGTRNGYLYSGLQDLNKSKADNQQIYALQTGKRRPRSTHGIEASSSFLGALKAGKPEVEISWRGVTKIRRIHEVEAEAELDISQEMGELWVLCHLPDYRKLNLFCMI